MLSKNRLTFLLVGVMSLSMAAFGSKLVTADEAKENNPLGELLKGISTSKHSLAEGIKQTAQGPVVPISAKLEMDEGKLSLSVYTVDKQNNVFKEVAGAPVSEVWAPKSETIKEGEDLEAAQNQWKVLSAAKFSLLDFAEKAQKDQPGGTILSVTPEVEGDKNVCEVRVAAQGKVIEIHYDVVSGAKADVE